MDAYRNRIFHAVVLGCAAALLSACAVGGGVFGTRIADGTATTRVKAGSVAVHGSGVSVDTTDEVIGGG